MKKFFSIVLAVLLIAGCVVPAVSVSAEEGAIKPYFENGYLFYEADKGSLANGAAIAYADWYGGRPGCTDNIFVILSESYASVTLDIDVPYEGYYNIGASGSTYSESGDAYCSLYVNGYEYYYVANHEDYCKWSVNGASYYDYGISGFATAGGVWLNAGKNTVSFNINNGWILIDRLAISAASVNIPDDDAVALVREAIADLPDELDEDTYKGVATVLESYEALNSFQKTLITGEEYTILFAKVEEAKQFDYIKTEVFNDDGYSYQAEGAILDKATIEYYLPATGDKFIDIKDGTATFKFKVPYDGYYKIKFSAATYNDTTDTTAIVKVGDSDTEYYVRANHENHGSWTLSGLDTFDYDNNEYVPLNPDGFYFKSDEINKVVLSSYYGAWMLFDRMVLVPDSLTYPDEDEAGAVFGKIQSLPETLTVDDKDAVQEAKSGYDALDAIGRVAVINVKDLNKAFDEMKALNVIEPAITDSGYAYEAENAMYTDRAAISDSDSASGNKYINIAYGTLYMNIDVPVSGNYKLKIYGSTNASDASKCDIVYVNDENKGFVAYSKSSFGTWAECEPGAENWEDGEIKPIPAESIRFNKGNNMITIRANWGNTNYDKIVLEPVDIDGDVNGDKALDADDLSALVNHILGTATAENADVNGDGNINILDVVALKKLLVGIKK